MTMRVSISNREELSGDGSRDRVLVVEVIEHSAPSVEKDESAERVEYVAQRHEIDPGCTTEVYIHRGRSLRIVEAES